METEKKLVLLSNLGIFFNHKSTNIMDLGNDIPVLMFFISFNVTGHFPFVVSD